MEDLYQIGCIGFIKAIKRFDISFNVKLSTYAVPYILGEIKRFIRDDGIIKVSRSVKELAIKIRDIENDYLNKKGESISIKKLSEILEIPEEEICVAIDSSKQIESINDEIYEEGSNKIKLEIIQNNNDEHINLIEKLTLKKVIEELEEKEKSIIELRYFKDKTQVEVAKILGISQVQVSRIEKRTLKQMKEKLKCE